MRRAGSPQHCSSVPRIANGTPAACRRWAVAVATRCARASKEPAHPTQRSQPSPASDVVSRFMPSFSSGWAQAARSARPNPQGLWLTSRWRSASSASDGQLALAHREVPPQVDDEGRLVDVDRALVHARVAGQALPDRVSAHSLPGRCGRRRRLERRAQVEHGASRTQRLARDGRRADVLAASAARAGVERQSRHPLQFLRPRESVRLARLVLEIDRRQQTCIRVAQRLLQRRQHDVGELAVRQPGEERESPSQVGPPYDPVRRRQAREGRALEGKREEGSDRGPGTPGVVDRREPHALEDESSDQDEQERAEDQEILDPSVGADRRLPQASSQKDGDAGDRQQPQRVHGDGDDEVPPAPVNGKAEVGFEKDGHGAHDEREGAPEDEGVRETASGTAPQPAAEKPLTQRAAQRATGAGAQTAAAGEDQPPVPEEAVRHHGPCERGDEVQPLVMRDVPVDLTCGHTVVPGSGGDYRPQLLGEERDHGEEVTDDAVVGALEDRRLGVLVDGDDHLGR